MNKQVLGIVLLCCLVLLSAVSAQESSQADCEPGTSTEDRQGCLDSDGDGWSDPDEAWNTSMGADAFPNNASEHRDLDGDGIGDISDPDMDGDGANDDVDVWPEDAVIWSDTDGDGYADQGLHAVERQLPEHLRKEQNSAVGLFRH